MGSETRVEISAADDILTARQRGRAMAVKLGFSGSETTLIAAAISEIARNIVEHAETGELLLDCIQTGEKRGIRIVARDKGPGIEDVERAMHYGYSTRNAMGAGLPAAKWLMDEFDIVSRPGEGTIVTMKKWVSHFGKHEH